MQLKKCQKAANYAPHSGFTDICRFGTRRLICFREASTHMSGDGTIKVLMMDDDAKVIWRENIRLPGFDLRDPKLSVTPEGKLLLLAYARQPDAQNRTYWARSICWFSGDGLSWSQPRFLAAPYWWLWRITWQQNDAYGFAYNRTANALDLYKGNPRRQFELWQPGVLSLERHQRGYPNESVIRFAANGTAYAVVRRDADTGTAMLGTATAPYKHWQWRDINAYIGAPDMVLLNDNEAIVAGRFWLNRQPKTGIGLLSLTTASVSLLTTLPSAGDSSYPGLSMHNGVLSVSYYSCHENRQSSIFLAELQAY